MPHFHITLPRVHSLLNDQGTDMLDEEDKTNSHVSVHEKVFQSTLDETSHNTAADPCVICLENVSEKATAHPCKHDNFDFICLASWVQERSSCPLCKWCHEYVEYRSITRDLGKAVITAIHYGPEGKPKVYKIDADNATSNKNVCSASSILPSSTWIQQFRGNQRHASRQSITRGRKRPRLPSPSNEAMLSRRRRIYELNLYSLHVGSNRLSGYSDLTPPRFANDPHLVSRARMWIRRELSLFNSLTTIQHSTSGQNSNRESLPQAHRASANAEFLLEYIVAILKTVDIKGSRGQAQEMLVGFLGENSALFLHELNSWLRSPFEDLAAWDRNVRYDWPERETSTFDSRIRRGTAMIHSEESVRRKRTKHEY